MNEVRAGKRKGWTNGGADKVRNKQRKGWTELGREIQRKRGIEK